MIYTELKGGLGNQMFIYAFAYALSRENNNEPICFSGQTNGISLFNYNLKNLESKEIRRFPLPFMKRLLMRNYSLTESRMDRMDFYQYEEKHMEQYLRSGLFLCQNGYLPLTRKNTKKKDIYLNGYFQSEKYFKKYKKELKQIFQPESPVMEINRNVYEEILDNPEAVFVGIRLGDYVNNKLHEVCTIDYYKDAMEYMATKLKHPVFYIFSTDVDLITEMTKDWGYHMVIENGKSPDYETLRLMSGCKHFIISNSTFNWWAQYLSENDNKTVIAPSKWFGLPCPCDIYQEDWILLE
jgi:hypothetical protein